MKKTIILVALLAALQLLVGNNIRNWELQYTSVVEQLQMLRQSAGMIYGVGYKYFVKSSNGSDFQNIMVDNQDSLHLYSVFMISEAVGYCGGQIYNQSNSATSHPVLYKTTDGGQTWVRTYQLESHSSRYILQNVQFTSVTEGYAVLNPYGYAENLKIYKTINGGQNWTLIQSVSGNAVASDFKSGLMVISKTSPNSLLVSVDGSNWQLVQNIIGYCPLAVLASTSSRLVIPSQIGMVYSDDFGQNWTVFDDQDMGEGFALGGCLTSCQLSNRSGNIYSIASVWDGSGHPGIIRSTNNGESWQWAVMPSQMPELNDQVYGILYANNNYLYLLMNLKIYRIYVGPVANDDPTTPVFTNNLICYPNPFRGSTNVTIKQMDSSPTTVAIYNLRGQLISTVVNNQELSPGEHSFSWDGKNDNGQSVAAGIYFFKMISGKYSATRKMLLLR